MEHVGMRFPSSRLAAAVCFLALPVCSGMAASIAASTTDSGGQRTASEHYVMDGSLGRMGGIASNTAQAEVVKHGYIGQLSEVATLHVTPSPSAIDEHATGQLGGVAGLDDDTVLVLEGSNVLWSATPWPIASISPEGVATAMGVYSNTFGTVTGCYLGVTGSGALLVLDSNPDNFGHYAGDGLPDWWQVRYFGLNSGDAVSSANPDSDPFNNEQEYTADTDPTNPLSFFYVEAMSNVPPSQFVCFLSSTGRTYTLLYGTNLVSGTWTNLPANTDVHGNGELMPLCDTNSSATRFYRVQVQMPPSGH